MEDLEENVSLMLKILTTGGFKPMNLFSNLIFLNNLIFFFLCDENMHVSAKVYL